MLRLVVTTLALGTLLNVIAITQADAKGCDGFTRCRCGTTAARLHGLPYNYQGHNLKQAATWYIFPRTTCHAGAVGIPHAHHVYTVNHCNGDGTASVTDDAGTYTRRVAGNVFVDPNGNATTPRHRTYSARSHGHHRHTRYVQYHEYQQVTERPMYY
jgi:hypothetical protein